MNYIRILICILIMAVVTYLPRMLPLTIFRKKIQNQFLKSFLAYVPYAVLAAMTFPEILSSTGNLISGLIGLATAIILAFFNRGLLVVALGSAGAVFAAEQVMRWIGMG